MSDYEIDRAALNGAEPICFGYKAVEWDSGTKQDFKYGEAGAPLVGKIFRVDGKIKPCRNGLHFCKDPADVFSFYNPYGYNRYFKVAAFLEAVDDESGKKTVAQCIEFLEEFDLMQFVNLVKSFDHITAVRSSTAVSGSTAVSDSDAVSFSNAVRGSNAVSGSTAVSDSTAVRYSAAVRSSNAVSDSTAVRSSNAVSDSTAVSFSNAVSGSNAVRSSTAVSGSTAVSDSDAVSDSTAVRYSTAVRSSNAVSFSDAVSGSDAVFACFGVRNCAGLYESLFCVDLKGGAFLLFNKQSTEKRVKEVKSRILKFAWVPEFLNWKECKGDRPWYAFCFPMFQENENADAWSGIPADMLAYIQDLPEFDADVWARITGE